MPHSPEAERSLAEARAALAAGAFRPASDAAWEAAVAATRIDDEETLEQLAELTVELAREAGTDEADQLRRYVALCLEDARNGTRPQSAFERLLGWDKPKR
jgi:hypothetical protein